MENKYDGHGIMYDLSILAELDEPKYVLEMISLFLTNCPPDFAELTRVVNEKDWSEVEKRAHKLKGATGILQATSVATILAWMEKNARDNTDLDQMPQQLEELTGLFQILEHQLVQEHEQIKKGME
jgi:HPt (histidine-containing phosphotransfer) domain-containing protein